MLGGALLNFAIQTAHDAGRILAERFGRNIEISHKGEIDLVTEADLAAEHLIIERIRSYYPRHAILAEEARPLTEYLSGLTGVIDSTIEPRTGHQPSPYSMALADKFARQGLKMP